LETEEKKLRETFPSEGKRKVSENPEQGERDDREAPKFTLPRAEWLRINACESAN